MRRALIMSKQHKVTEYQERVYAALLQIPEGRITTYAAMSKALESSPRAVGGALRVNPFAPEVPCHRCIASTGVSEDTAAASAFYVRDLMLDSSLAGSKATGKRHQADKTSNPSCSC
jgi:O-6-methylguanine DNA methyltransferase